MIRVCPNPIPWNKAFIRLAEYAKQSACTPPAPPTPLVLAGWAYSNDAQKKARWDETVAWAVANGCSELVSSLADAGFYITRTLSTYAIGPVGGPMYLPWSFEAKGRPCPTQLDRAMTVLTDRWSTIVGEDLAGSTSPRQFTGKKARRLLVIASAGFRPPWGGWDWRSELEAERRTFTAFRAAINSAISPHMVDHIGFRVLSLVARGTVDLSARELTLPIRNGSLSK